MTVKGTVALGMLAFAALAGCTTGSASVAGDPNRGTDAQASPAGTSSYYENEKAADCTSNGGWYDSVAGACDDNGE